jgi:hypothetical protein
MKPVRTCTPPRTLQQAKTQSTQRRARAAPLSCSSTSLSNTDIFALTNHAHTHTHIRTHTQSRCNSVRSSHVTPYSRQRRRASCNPHTHARTHIHTHTQPKPRASAHTARSHLSGTYTTTNEYAFASGLGCTGQSFLIDEFFPLQVYLLSLTHVHTYTHQTHNNLYHSEDRTASSNHTERS